MRFYGIPSEERALEIIKGIDSGEWVFEEVKTGSKEYLNADQARERLRGIVEQVRRWKEEFTTMTKATIFIFVHEPDSPKAFKIYDTSSLGCSTELTPPRWKVYLREFEGRV